MRRHTQVQHNSISGKTWALIVAPLFFVCAAAILNVVMYASVGSVGGELYAISRKTDQLKSANQTLRETLAKQQSLHETLSQAQATGYIPITGLTAVESKDTKVALGVSSQNIHE